MNPRAIFEIDGVRYDSWKEKELFSRVSVELTTGEASQATWEIFDPEFRVINKYSLVDGIPMSNVRVWLGFGPNLGEPVFKGLVARVQRGKAKTTFISYDMGYRMRLEQKTDYHKGTDLEIIKKIVERTSIGDGKFLQFVGPASPLKIEPHKANPQDGQTDWEYISEVAHDAGLLLWVVGDTVFADYPAKVGTPKRTLVCQNDFELLWDFDLAFKNPENKAGRPKGIEVRGRGRGGKRLTGHSDKSSRGHEGLKIKRDLSQHTKKRATARAQAQKELDREHAFELSVRAINPMQRKDWRAPSFQRDNVRDTIRIQEVGKLFSGDYLADRVTHEFAPGRLTTGYELYRDVKE